MLEMINSRDFTHVSDLSARFRVSQVTVRADLKRLAEQGHIQRLRGGALPVQPRTLATASYPGSIQSAPRSYGQAAADLVRSGEALFLDAGSLAIGIAGALVRRTDVRELVIFTNALPVALALEPAIPRFSVIVTGGTLDPRNQALVNPLGDLLLAGIRIETLFLVPAGVDLRGGVTTGSLAQAESKRRVIEAARRKVVIAESGRLGSVQLFSLCSLREIDILITDQRANPAIVRALRKANVQVILV